MIDDWYMKTYSNTINKRQTKLQEIWLEPNLNYTVFQKKLTPRTFMITVWNENQFK